MFFLYDHPTGHLLAIIGEGDVRHLIGDPRDTDLENRRFSYGAAELGALARASRTRVLGPSSLGVICADSRLVLTANAAFAESDLPVGRTFVASQSGSMIGALVSRGRGRPRS